MSDRRQLFSRKKVMVSIQIRFGQMEGGYTAQKRKLLGEAVELAEWVRDTPGEFDAFCHLEFFEERKNTMKVEHVLRYVMAFVLNAKDKPMYDRACTYAKALNNYMIEDLSADQVADRIEADGGIEKLYRESVERKKVENTGLQIETAQGVLSEVFRTGIDEMMTITIKRVTDGPKGWKRFELVAVSS